VQRPQPRLGDVLESRQRRRNARALFKYVALVVGVVALYSALFHVIMWRAEGQQFSWITGLYWTLSTMSTLGVGDVVFVSDLGRLFTVIVLISGILLFLIVLPFSFIRYFYTPWLETPRLPARMAGHVIIVGFDNIALPLIEKLELHEIPYYVVEPDPTRAARMFSDGVSVVAGAIDDRATYDRLKIASARLVASSLTNKLLRWLFTVLSVMCNTWPIARLLFPSASNFKICSSRSVSWFSCTRCTSFAATFGCK